MSTSTPRDLDGTVRPASAHGEDRRLTPLWRLADWLLGARPKARDLVERRHLQATALLFGGLTTIGFVSSGLVYLVGLPARALSAFIASAVSLLNIYYLRRTGNPRHAGVVVSLLIVAYVAFDAISMGAFHATSFAPIYAAPIVAGLTAGTRAGRALLAIVTAVVIATWAWPVAAPTGPPGGYAVMALTDRLMTVVMMLVLIVGIVAQQNLLARVLANVRRELDVHLTRLQLAERPTDPRDRTRRLGATLSEIAHELANPLTVALAGVGSAPRAQDDEAFVARLQDVSTSIERMRTIVSDLQDRARTRQATPLVPVLREAIAATESELRRVAHVDVDLDACTGSVFAEPVQLGQVFVNLLSNASQAVAAGAPATTIRVTARVDDDTFVVQIADEGVGLPPDAGEAIFEPFWTTRHNQGGTGLGLAICRREISALGGELSLDPNPGGGTIASVRLPRMSERSSAQSPASTEPEHTPTPSSRLRILAIDDEPLILEMIEIGLEPADVVAVTDAREALPLWADGGFDLVVCDVMMPNMTGIQFFDELTRCDPTARERFLFITGGVFTDDARQLLETMDDRVLYKPFSLDELAGSVASLVARANHPRRP